jgi:hypothetical protein
LSTTGRLPEKIESTRRIHFLSIVTHTAAPSFQQLNASRRYSSGRGHEKVDIHDRLPFAQQHINHFDIEVDDDFARALDPMDEPDFNSPGYVSKMRAHTESLKMQTGLTDWLVTLLPVQFQKNYEVFVTEFGMPMPGVEQELIKLLQAELPDAKRI